jgi:hypothetical protein
MGRELLRAMALDGRGLGCGAGAVGSPATIADKELLVR